MTRAGRDGAMATCCTHATRKKVIAPTFIRFSLLWHDRKEFLRALKLDFHYPLTSHPEKSPVITAGQNSSVRKTDGSPLIYRRLGNTQRRRIIFSAAMMRTESNSRWAGT